MLEKSDWGPEMELTAKCDASGCPFTTTGKIQFNQDSLGVRGEMVKVCHQHHLEGPRNRHNRFTLHNIGDDQQIGILSISSSVRQGMLHDIDFINSGPREERMRRLAKSLLERAKREKSD